MNNNPSPEDFYGFYRIDASNYKEFEPKQSLDLFWLDEWFICDGSKFFTGHIYRRRILIPDGWELVPLCENVNLYCKSTTDGKTFRALPAGITETSVSQCIKEFTRIKALIRRKEPVVSNKGVGICECGHNNVSHDLGGFGSCIHCACKQFTPKQKGSDSMKKQVCDCEVGEVCLKCEPGPEIASAGVGAIYLCSVCESRLEAIHPQSCKIKPCQHCLDAAKGEWVVKPEGKLDLTRLIYLDVQLDNGVIEHGWLPIEVLHCPRVIRYWKPATIPDPPPIETKESEDEKLINEWLDNCEMIKIRPLLRAIAKSSIAYARKEKS